MITNPTKNMVPQMKNIWKLCFGDSDEVINSFFDICFNENDSLVNLNGYTVVSMLFLIPSNIKIDGDIYKNRYLYAVCTHPDFEGQGKMTELLNEAICREKENGTASIACIPATESLFDFYGRFGFKKAICSYEKQFSRDELQSKSSVCDYSSSLTGDEISDYRENLLNEFPHIEFFKNYLLLANSFGYKYIFGNDFYAFFSEENGKIKVVDAVYNNKSFGDLCYAILKETRGNYFTFFTPKGERQSKTTKGVLLNLNDVNALKNVDIYLGIKME